MQYKKTANLLIVAFWCMSLIQTGTAQAQNPARQSATPPQANAPATASKGPTAMLRVACDGDNTGAEVSLNGQFKGECPFDLPLAEGSWTLRAVKRDGKERERVYETEFRIASGTVKRLDIELGAAQLTAEGAKVKHAREAQERRIAQEREEQERRAAQDKAAREAQLARDKQAAVAARAQELARFAANPPEQLLASAQGGNAAAMAVLGESYLTGRGVTGDAAQALRWFSSAAQGGNARGMAGLGYMTVSGIGIPANATTGKSWVRRAVDEGDAMGLYVWGTLVQPVSSQTADLRERLGYLKQAADAGSGDAGAWLAYYAMTGRYPAITIAEAADQLQRFADQGSPVAAHWLGLCHLNGFRGVTCQGIAKNDALALRWMRTAADRGERGAMFEYGMQLERGTFVSKDEAQALVWWRRAAEFGFPQAMFYVGMCYGLGTNGMPRDKQQYLEWLRRAAAAGDVSARDELASPRM